MSGVSGVSEGAAPARPLPGTGGSGAARRVRSLGRAEVTRSVEMAQVTTMPVLVVPLVLSGLLVPLDALAAPWELAAQMLPLTPVVDLMRHDTVGSMTGWWRWWRERGSAERMDAITRWPLYLFSATEPGLVLLAISSRPGAWGLAAGGLLVVSALHAVACVVLLRAGLAAHLGGRRAAAPLVAGVAAGAVVLAAMGTAIPGFDADPGGGGMPVTLIVTMIAGGASTAAVAPLLRTPSLLACVVVGAAGCALIQAMVDAVAPAADVGLEVTPLQAAGYYAYPIVLVALTYRVSTWMLGVVWEIDRSRRSTPASPWPRSGCGSPGTCTTCWAGTCR
ncbi:hypothetical protein Franean1_6813 [Parafrankia sp. EAN1pec]|uniref:hypothetical protein n=1 Tax=Parafrankia sp. (strain EAN1pec) TaxID=298653 RepID=UPI0000541DA7|nr:hypothetical protein Franean1_6813 [Frankia sp. EAN1pec]